MIDDLGEGSELLHRVASGEQEAARILFSQYRDRLKRMVHLRLSRRLSGRVDDSDVLQEAFIEVARKLPDYAREPNVFGFGRQFFARVNSGHAAKAAARLAGRFKSKACHSIVQCSTRMPVSRQNSS